MNPFELLQLVLENLGRRKGRVALTALGVLIGTAAVVTLISLASGLQRSAQESFGDIGNLRLINVYPSFGEGITFSGPGGSQQAESIITDQTIREIRQIPHVVSVVPRDNLQASATLEYNRLENFASVIGVGTTDITDMGLEVGTGGTTQLNRGTAIIGYNVQTGFYDPNQRPGQAPPPPPDLLNRQVKLVVTKTDSEGNQIEKVVQLRVVGIIPQSQDESDYSIYMPISDVVALNEWASGQRVNRARAGYGQLYVFVDETENVISVTEQITAMNFQAFTLQQILQSTNTFFLIIQVVFGGVGAIALLVAAIGIANTMTMAILERTREIGLMKAVGATNRDVLSVFLGEAAGIGLLGGLGGVLLGWLGGLAINVVGLSFLAQQAAESGGLTPSSVVVTPLWLPIFAVIFSALIGLISGLYPALRAATLVPVSALKYE